MLLVTGRAIVTRSKDVVRSLCSAVTEGANKEDQKLSYLRNVYMSNESDATPPDWDTAKPFESIPGPKPLPVIGNIWRFFPGGTYYGMDQLTQHRSWHNEFGDIVRLCGLKIRKDAIILFTPEDIEKSMRNEGVWPMRESMESLVYYRLKIRNDVFKGEGGVLTSQGEKWYNVRSVVNPPMMQPRSAQMYVGSMDRVAQDFVRRVQLLADQNPQGEMPEDFSNELNKWALESICVIGLNRHLGLLDPNLQPNSEGQKFIYDVLSLFVLLNELDVKPSLWKWVSTPTWRNYVKTLDRITAFEKKYLDLAEAEMMKKDIEKLSESELSIIERLLKKDKRVAFAMSFDMLIAGIDTTSRIVSAALYYIAANPRVQEKLRAELKKYLPNPDTPVTNSILTELRYLKALIKETLRLAPIAIGNLRQSTKPLVLSGYQIPKGTDIISSNMMLCRKEENFVSPEEFLPDRWMRNEDNEYINKDLNPWVYMPFGFGPRSCVGKRLANLEIEIILAKLIRNFQISWPHKEMTWKMDMLYGVGDPLKFHVKKIQS